MSDVTGDLRSGAIERLRAKEVRLLLDLGSLDLLTNAIQRRIKYKGVNKNLLGTPTRLPSDTEWTQKNK